VERAYKSITVGELKSRLDAGESLVLLDVREPWEYETARIEGSTLVPMREMETRFGELDPSAETVVICHHGTRSAFITQLLDRAGFDNVLNLEGGVDAYSQVDETMPRY
jgi:rhodanese-related sulfurtransferase